MTVIGVPSAIIEFPVFNGFRYRAEFPDDAPLKVEFFLLEPPAAAIAYFVPSSAVPFTYRV